jgi:hypothetical protein
MAQIGTLTTGAGAVTSFNGLSQLDEFLLIGDADTANPLQGLTVEVNGETLINIQVQALITAFAKWLMEMTGSTVGVLLKLATGRIKGNTNIRLINSGATTPAVYAFSDSDGGLPFISATEVILAGAFSDFRNFSALMISAPANLQSAIVEFEDGYTTSMTAVELGAYFTIENNAEADGYLGGVLVVDNRNARIKSIRLFATGANLNVLKVQLPE